MYKETRTNDEMDDLIDEWHDAPAGSEIWSKELHEHLGLTWKEYQEWVANG